MAAIHEFSRMHETGSVSSHPLVLTGEAMSNSQTARHSIGKTVLLHLLPGLLALAVFILIARPVESLGCPSMMAWLVYVLLTILPFELGYLYYQGVKRNGRPSLAGVILYRQPLGAGRAILWTALTFLAEVGS